LQREGTKCMLDSENCARDSYGDVVNAGADLAFSSIFSPAFHRMLSRFLRRRVFNTKGAKCTMDVENGARNS